MSCRPRRAARRAGEPSCRVNEKTIYRWETGKVPQPDHLRYLAAALEQPVERLVVLAQQGDKAGALQRFNALKSADPKFAQSHRVDDELAKLR